MLGPILAILVRNANGNYILIIIIGIIFEIIGVIGFYFYLRNDLLKEEEIKPVKKRKGRSTEEI